MLSSLTIQNYALISRLEIDFHSGLSVLTGETGAGKSIILGALALILGQRADTKAIKQGKDKCVIEGSFDIESYHLKDLFNENDWEFDARHCIIRREIYAGGKSRAFINDMPVSLNDIRELVSRLIDVHSQHQNLLLGDNRFQMQVVDALTGRSDLFDAYRHEYKRYLEMKRELTALQKEAEESRAEEDYLRFQLTQLEEANLQTGEQASLEQEMETLSHIEEIKGGLFRLVQLLSEDERGLISLLKESTQTAHSLQKIYGEIGEIHERFESAYIDMKEIVREIAVREEALEYNPERLQELTDRLNLLFSLQQKHRVNTVEELIEIRESMMGKITTIDRYEEQIDGLQKEIDDIFEAVCILAKQLSEHRKKAAQALEKELIKKVSVLGMPNMKFSCRITEKPMPDASGSDDITFLFSANKNVDLQPVSQIASGGEIARLMLGIKALIAGSIALPTIIFDEIDTGVSGDIAGKMGDIMRELGTLMQVITITHLPQIAAKGNHHYYVYKEEKKDSTETHIRKLDDEERVREIAQMLSGSELSEAAIANARELLKTNNHTI